MASKAVDQLTRSESFVKHLSIQCMMETEQRLANQLIMWIAQQPAQPTTHQVQYGLKSPSTQRTTGSSDNTHT